MVTALTMAMNDHESTTSIDFEKTDKFDLVGQLVNMESMNDEDLLYMPNIFKVLLKAVGYAHYLSPFKRL